MVTVTVFTPTYNRSKTLHRVYESLCRQTVAPLEWLIIDDGSVDNTKEIVSGWEKEGKIKMRYVYKNNAGKFMALKDGVGLVEGDLFLIADSDDRFEPFSIERFVNYYTQFTPPIIINRL